MIYQWKEGSRINADAEEVGREIAALGSAVEAASVVAAAQKDDSAMHDCFEWDDGTAAEEYRLTQAREIMRSLVYVVEKVGEPDDIITVRAYENVDIVTKKAGEDDEHRRAYVPTAKVLRKPEFRAQVFARLEGDIIEAERTASKYKYLCKSFAEVEKRLVSAREAIRN